MSLALILFGAVALIAAVRDTQGDLFNLLKQDFTGQNNFVYWMLAILLVGGLGYVPKLRGFSNAFLALLLVVIFLKKGTGFFSQLSSAVQSTSKVSS